MGLRRPNSAASAVVGLLVPAIDRNLARALPKEHGLDVGHENVRWVWDSATNESSLISHLSELSNSADQRPSPPVTAVESLLGNSVHSLDADACKATTQGSCAET